RSWRGPARAAPAAKPRAHGGWTRGPRGLVQDSDENDYPNVSAFPSAGPASRGRDGRRRRRGGAFGPGLERQPLLTVDGHVARGVDAEANLAPVDIDDGDADVLTDVDLFTELAAEDQHGRYPPSARRGCRPAEFYATNG